MCLRELMCVLEYLCSCVYVCMLVCVYVCLCVGVFMCVSKLKWLQGPSLLFTFSITAARFENVQGTWHSPYGFGGTGCGVWTRAGVYFLRAASVEAQTAALVCRFFSFTCSVLLRPLNFGFSFDSIASLFAYAFMLPRVLPRKFVLFGVIVAPLTFKSLLTNAHIKPACIDQGGRPARGEGGGGGAALAWRGGAASVPHRRHHVCRLRRQHAESSAEVRPYD
jgi:hypothetical protein